MNRRLLRRLLGAGVVLGVASLGLGPSLPPGASGAPPPGALVASYNFDGSGGTLVDTSGNANNGTISGATWTTAGKNGGALSFNGTNNMVSVNDSPSLDLTGAMTIEAWVRPTTLSSWRTVLLKETADGLAYALYANESVQRPRAEITVGNQAKFARGTAALALNQWSHLATTFDGSALRLYVNGNLVATANTTGPIPVSNSPLRIGGNAIWGEYFAGQIDDVRIYNAALTQEDIRVDRDTPVPGVPANDTTPPAISQVAASTQATSATVTWTTDEPADSRVEYGPTTSYGSSTALDANLVTGHSQSINGLSSGATYHYRVVSKDASGNTATSGDLSFTTAAPDTVLPTVSLTSPTAGSTVSGSVTVTATAGDNVGVAGVQFLVDGANVGAEDTVAPYSISWNSTGVTNGSHTVSARARDAAGNTATSQVQVTVSNQSDGVAPTVAVTSPASGATVSGTVNVTATASDNVGVVGVQFLLDGNNLGAEDTVAPYTTSWNTASGSSGAHVLTARARDAAGNVQTSTAVNVTVANGSDPAVVGQWGAVQDWPMVAVHAVLMPTGDILLMDGWELPSVLARVWSPTTGNFVSVPYGSGLFCAGHVVLPDGRVLMSGGHAGGEIGTKDSATFDPVTRTWTRHQDMNYARWYPSTTTLGDGRVLSLSGQITPGEYADVPEIFDPKTNRWTTMPVNTASMHDPEYPLSFLAPNGKIYAVAATPGTFHSIDVANNAWANLGNLPRKLGTAAMYAPGKLLYSGGGAVKGSGQTALKGASTIDLTQPTPTWQTVGSMAYPRYQHNLVVLPDGTVLAVGGASVVSQATGSGSLPAEIFNPSTGAWTTMAAQVDTRGYHSTALLLPDGRVLSAGGGRLPGAPDYFSAEIYSPPYLFKGARPVISSAPSSATWAQTIDITSPDAANITSVSIVGMAAVTHTLDMAQRYVDLSFTRSGDQLRVTLPANRNVLPPGQYMVFIKNGSGVPSTAAILKVDEVADTTPPSAPASLTATAGVGSAQLSWTAATDNVGVASYNVHRSTTSGFTPSAGTKIGTSATTTYTDSGVAGGTYYYKVTAQDGAGNVGPPSGQATAVIQGDPTPPTVTLTSPPAGTVSGLVTLSANASDNVAVAGVQFRVDGTAVGAEDTAAPYSTSWNSSSVSNGTHTISAVARDGSGNTATASVTVTVSNTSTMVAAYAFEEGSGTQIIDQSGLGNHGTLSGGARVNGRNGGGVLFNGTSDAATIADAASLDLTTGMTLEAWVQPATLNGWTTVVLKERTNGLAYSLYASDNSNQPPSGTVNVGGSDRVALGTSTIPLGQWTHLATTYDGASLKMFVNGVQVRSTAITGAITTSNSPLRIGGNSIWGEYFSGVIDEVRVYNRALSATEIQSDMNSPIVSASSASATQAFSAASVTSSPGTASAAESTVNRILGGPAAPAGASADQAAATVVPEFPGVAKLVPAITNWRDRISTARSARVAVAKICTLAAIPKDPG